MDIIVIILCIVWVFLGMASSSKVDIDKTVPNPPDPYDGFDDFDE